MTTAICVRHGFHCVVHVLEASYLKRSVTECIKQNFALKLCRLTRAYVFIYAGASREARIEIYNEEGE